jgi:DNA-binding response OmpR family regulator
VEDDKKTASLVALYLEREGFEVIQAHDGKQALDLARRHEPILVVLDLMIPVIDGREVCRRLRRRSDVPILMLTARGEEVDRVSGLTMGADDYVVKPFSPRELVARVKAVLRRAGTRKGFAGEPQTCRNWFWTEKSIARRIRPGGIGSHFSSRRLRVIQSSRRST